MFANVLFPLNLKESMSNIHSLARSLKSFDTQRLVLLTVLSSNLSGKQAAHAHKKLETVKNQLEEYNFHIEILLRSGHVATEITRAANELDTGFICMTWKKKPFIRYALLGSHTKDVIRLSDAPIFMFKRSLFSSSDTRLNAVLYATDFEANDHTILPYLNYEGLKANQLVILNVGQRAPDPNAEQKRLQRVYDKLLTLKDKCINSFDEIETVASIGNPKRVILRESRKNNADVIVLGKYTDSSTMQKVMGSTAESIAHRSRVSVLIIPRK